MYTCGDPGRRSTSLKAGRSNCSRSRQKGESASWAIHTAGDIFGELCLSGLGVRMETAPAVEETVLKNPCPRFFAQLSRDEHEWFRAVPGGADCRPTASDRQYGDSGPANSASARRCCNWPTNKGKPARVIDRDLGLQHFARFRDSSESLGEAVEQTADSVIITDKEGFIEYVNPAFETTTGYSREDALGQDAANS